MTTVSRKHRPLATAAAAIVFVAIAAPVTAYVVVPAFAKRAIVEDLPLSPTVPAANSGARISASDVETLLKGELVRISFADYGSGAVRIVRVGSDRLVRFEGVDIAGAPDMYVYLSDRTDGTPGIFFDLGKLKATNGSFNQLIPASVDLAMVRSVVIWCRQFAVTVTFAVMN